MSININSLSIVCKQCVWCLFVIQSSTTLVMTLCEALELKKYLRLGIMPVTIIEAFKVA